MSHKNFANGFYDPPMNKFVVHDNSDIIKVVGHGNYSGKSHNFNPISHKFEYLVPQIRLSCSVGFGQVECRLFSHFCLRKKCETRMQSWNNPWPIFPSFTISPWRRWCQLWHEILYRFFHLMMWYFRLWSWHSKVKLWENSLQEDSIQPLILQWPCHKNLNV
jgi:hypothetical protein